MEEEGAGETWRCAYCPRTFETEHARNGHMSSHFGKKRKSAQRNFIQKKYVKDPKKESEITKQPIRSNQYHRPFCHHLRPSQWKQVLSPIQ